jgi:hypothetical protein
VSVEAISWALSQKVERSSAKFVLVAMANCAGPDMLCWPSAAYLCDATAQDRKTVTENLKRLREMGFIEPTEARKGATNQVIVYRLKTPEIGAVEQAQKRNTSENGTHPKTDGKTPVFPHEQARKRTETGPKTGDGTIRNHKEPSGNRTREQVAVSKLVADGLTEQTATEFLSHRKQKRAALTPRAWDGIKAEAVKAGWPLEAAILKTLARGWQSFDAEFVAKEPKPGGAVRSIFAGAL